MLHLSKTPVSELQIERVIQRVERDTNHKVTKNDLRKFLASANTSMVITTDIGREMNTISCSTYNSIASYMCDMPEENSDQSLLAKSINASLDNVRFI